MHPYIRRILWSYTFPQQHYYRYKNLWGETRIIHTNKGEDVLWFKLFIIN